MRHSKQLGYCLLAAGLLAGLLFLSSPSVQAQGLFVKKDISNSKVYNPQNKPVKVYSRKDLQEQAKILEAQNRTQTAEQYWAGFRAAKKALQAQYATRNNPNMSAAPNVKPSTPVVPKYQVKPETSKKNPKPLWLTP